MNIPSNEDLEYVLLLGWQLFPEINDEPYEDGTFGGSCAIECSDFQLHYTSIIDRFPFKKEDFFANDDICIAVKEYGLDLEKFWYVTAFIYYVTLKRCRKSFVRTPTIIEKFHRLYEYLDGARELQIKADDKNRLTLEGSEFIEILRDAISESSLGKHRQHFYICDTCEFETKSLSVWIWYAYNLYRELFKILKLPTKRTRNVKGTSQYKQGEWVLVGSKTKSYSMNKTLLASRLIYLMKLTENENFCYSEDAIKGILTAYKKREFSPYHV